MRATSRRTGSKADSTTASGVSSMMTSTPVACSNERMLRPSRPMMRPFISSEGSCTTDTVVSAVWSAAIRWMARAMIFFASRSPSRWACSLISRRLLAASARASFSRSSMSCLRASWALIPANCSSRLPGLFRLSGDFLGGILADRGFPALETPRCAPSSSSSRSLRRANCRSRASERSSRRCSEPLRLVAAAGLLLLPRLAQAEALLPPCQFSRPDGGSPPPPRRVSGCATLRLCPALFPARGEPARASGQGPERPAHPDMIPPAAASPITSGVAIFFIDSITDAHRSASYVGTSVDGPVGATARPRPYVSLRIGLRGSEMQVSGIGWPVGKPFLGIGSLGSGNVAAVRRLATSLGGASPSSTDPSRRGLRSSRQGVSVV